MTATNPSLNGSQKSAVKGDEFGESRFGEGEADRNLFGKTRFFCAAELEPDQESTGSSEETESPRSVTKVTRQWMPKKIAYVHIQVLRIREEDSHLGEVAGEGCSSKENDFSGHFHRLSPSQINLLLFSRPILPASPLSGKTDIKTVN